MKCVVLLNGSGGVVSGQVAMEVDGLDGVVEGRFVALGDNGNLKVAEGLENVVGWVERLVVPEGTLAVFREELV